MNARILSCLLFLVAAPGGARAGVVLSDPADHAFALAQNPGAGLAVSHDFETLPVGSFLSSQLASFGLVFTSPAPTVILPEAFGTPGNGTRLAVTGYAAGTGASLTLSFDEPQRTVSAWFVDLGEFLSVSALLNGEVVDELVVLGEEEAVPGGAFRALWIDGSADTLVFVGGALEDGFGVDDLAVALLGSVDNDGDGFTENGGDCDDADPNVFPGQGCDPPGDDDDAGGDDDDASDDDDSGGDDDDVSNDDDSVGDDDDASDDDDSVGDDDDDSGDDDDSAVLGGEGASGVRGLAGGGCACSSTEAGSLPSLGLLALLVPLAHRRRRSFGLLAFFVGFAALAPGLASADASFDTLRFDPAVTPSGGALTDGAHPGIPWQIDAGMVLTFARNELVFTREGEPTGEPVLQSRFAGTVRAAVNVGPRFRLAFDLPVVLGQKGVHPTTGAALPSGGVGDLAITPHLMILDPARRWLGVALAAPTTFPTSRSDALLGEAKPTVQPRVVIEKRMAWSRVPLLRLAATAQVGWRFRPRTELLDLDLAGELTFGLGLHWDPLDRVRVGAEVVGALGKGANGRYAEWIGHVRVVPDRRGVVSVSAGAGVGLGRGVGTPEGRLYVAATLHVPLRREAPVLRREGSVSIPLAPLESAPPAAASPSGPPIPGERLGLDWGLRLVGRTASIDADVLFAFDSARLRPEAQGLIEQVARWALDHPLALLEVGGHADPLGGRVYNQRLSEERAQAVVRALKTAGVEPERLSARGYGNESPLPPGPGSTEPDRWASSRRVEFRLLEPEPPPNRREGGL